MPDELDLRIRAKIQDDGTGPKILHLCVFDNREMQEKSSTDYCAIFQNQGAAEQVANLLDGLRHGDAALQVRELARQLPEK